MNNNNEIESNKVVYINEDEEDNNTTEMLTPTNNVTPEYTEENTRIENDEFIQNQNNEPLIENDINDNDDEYEEFTNKEDLLLNLKQSGYESDGGDISDSDSVATTDILKIDPLYLRLTKFLQTNDGESVADTLKKINDQLVMLNTNLSKNSTQ
jgi:hypothetical protein|tara:strand:+ start:41 stop:502 length:462 start_codon:yes stop_codon:yes gene_type:complete